TKFHSFVWGFFPCLQVSELEKAIVNISAVTEQIEHETSDAITALQEEISEIAKISTQNRMALDMLLASPEGVCTVINTSCCVYIDQSRRIATDLK
ncbi:ERVV2 protein, partial [Todus mexicanus]|nr:ERVV2 protein [Todus mexicanus]